jgi:hypothetical protein
MDTFGRFLLSVVMLVLILMATKWALRTFAGARGEEIAALY